MRRPALAALILPLAGSLVASLAAAQQGSAPDPLVPENATVQVGERTWVIPDGDVSLVPNVGIVVGSRATLVIDPGLGRRNGETVLREVMRLDAFEAMSPRVLVPAHGPVGDGGLIATNRAVMEAIGARVLELKAARAAYAEAP